jgi:hypothetical protein
MKLPVTVELDLFWKKAVFDWLNDNVNKGDVAFTWPYNTFAFEHEEDATAFLLTFGGKRKYTKVEQMIKDTDETC